MPENDRSKIPSESVFLEVYQAAMGGRPEIPIIGVLPRGRSLADWNRGWEMATVKWHPNSIIRAVRQFAAPTTVDELCLTPQESAERQHIIRMLEANDRHRTRSTQ